MLENNFLAASERDIMIFKEPAFPRIIRQAFRALVTASILVMIAAPAHAEEATEGEGVANTLEKASGVPVHGFANMGWADDSSTDFHRRFYRGFYLNNFDLYISPDMGDRVRFLTEVVFEPDSEDQQPSFDAERLQAGYVVNKNLTVWVGRFHTPIGYYVIAYHHGMQIQTAVEKPRFLDFEDHYGVLPVHTNGLWLNGNTTLGEQRIALMAWLGNSDRMTVGGSGFSSLDFGMGHSDNHHMSLGARVNWIASGSFDGLQVGATVLHETIDWMGGGTAQYGGYDANNTTTPASGGKGVQDTLINPNTGGTFTSNFLMYGAHAVYEANNIEFLNEVYGFHNSDKQNPGQHYTSYAGYSQLAYWIKGISAPYVRYERADFNMNDPFFVGQYNGLPYTKYAAGYRYNLTDNAAIKVELSKIKFGGSSNTNIGQNYNDAHIDYSIRF